MSPFWTGRFEHIKQCGRSATLFILTLVGLFSLLLLTAIIYAAQLHKYVLPVLPGIVLLAIVWGAVVIRRAQARRHERLHPSPLSRDELRVARSKLMKDRNR